MEQFNQSLEANLKELKVIEPEKLLWKLFSVEEASEGKHDLRLLRQLIAEAGMAKKARVVERVMYRRGGNEFLIYDSTQEVLKYHILAPETYYELKYEIKHSDEVIPELVKQVCDRYERLFPVVMQESTLDSTRKTLIASLFLTCRGQYTCPVDMRKYPSMISSVGGITKIDRWARKIGEKVHYSSNRMLENALSKLESEKIIDEKSKVKICELYDNYKSSGGLMPATRGFISALVYMSLEESYNQDPSNTKQFTQSEIASYLQVSIHSLKNNYIKIEKRIGNKK